MMLWLALGAMTLVVMAGLLLPLLGRVRNPASRQAHDIAVYRDQLEEVRADATRGVISQTEAEAATREIQRRILRTADEPTQKAADSGWRVAVAGVLAVAVPAAAALIYADLGRPWAPDQPLAARNIQPPPQPAPDSDPQLTDIASMREKLEARLANDPNDKQGWSLLGRTNWELGRFPEAAESYRRAIALGDAESGLLMAYAEALVFAAEGMVTPVAVQVLTDLRLTDPGHPGARYYLGLKLLQDDNPQAAYRAWLDLARDTPAGAPWIGPLRQRLVEVGQALDLDVDADLPDAFKADATPPAPPPQATAAIPGPSADDVKAAQDMSSEDRQAFIRSMVQRLADRLEDEPNDPQGWLRLGRAYSVLGEDAKSAEAYGKAAELEPNNGDALYQAGVGAAKAGNVDKAVGYWEKLLAGMDPNSPDYARLRSELDRVKATR
ncbi:MAG: c-type cytochrome biogenesis protein CcmI [Alphaproteobacteria bacterium]